ncbi:hypothetical protein HJC23_005533 [Cyclotella cryptica]|uniref:Uncharacterized protein n=1 Tax=Cyclotella cryptica TaxID=29204 RepID=A0ABD3PWM3_9STRA
MAAEQSAEAIDDTKYDLTANTCVHYAADIWRELDFEETEDLANFIFENFLKDDGALEYARQNVKYDGMHVPTSYLTGDGGGFEEYVKNIVHSQLDIMAAERSAEAIDDTKYDLTANTCVHYAADIWRELDFEETEDLANFIVENLLKDDGALEYARQNVKYDGMRVLTSYLTGDRGGFEEYVKNIVHSQLDINK